MSSKVIRRATGALAIVAGVFCSAASQATTITLDLSSLPTGAFTSPLTVDGFVLTPLLNGSSTPVIANENGLYALESASNIGAAGADTYLTMANGGSFSIVSVAVAALNGDNGSFGIGISAPGVPGGALYGSFFGNPISSSFTTEDLTTNASLQNVTTVDLDPVSEPADNFAIASITVDFTPAPEPATIATLGFGLVGLAAARRARR